MQNGGVEFLHRFVFVLLVMEEAPQLQLEGRKSSFISTDTAKRNVKNLES